MSTAPELTYHLAHSTIGCIASGLPSPSFRAIMSTKLCTAPFVHDLQLAPTARPRHTEHYSLQVDGRASVEGPVREPGHMAP